MIERAEVPIAVLLITLVYIYRSRPHLSLSDQAEEWAHHRVFLGSLMLASKVRVSYHRSALAESHDPDPAVHE